MKPVTMVEGTADGVPSEPDEADGASDADEPNVSAQLADRRLQYTEFFATQHQQLTRVAYLLCGDQHRAEEAVAEAFAKVWPHWKRGRVTDELAYMRRAVVNEVHSLGRRRGRDAGIAARTRARTASAHLDDPAADHDQLLAALAALPGRQRAAVVLRFYCDLTEAATAAALGMRLGTVKSQTSRALTRLRGLLSLEDQ